MEQESRVPALPAVSPTSLITATMAPTPSMHPGVDFFCPIVSVMLKGLHCRKQCRLLFFLLLCNRQTQLYFSCLEVVWIILCRLSLAVWDDKLCPDTEWSVKRRGMPSLRLAQNVLHSEFITGHQKVIGKRLFRGSVYFFPQSTWVENWWDKCQHKISLLLGFDKGWSRRTQVCPPPSPPTIPLA